jgi:hypothetical protein
MTAAQRKLAKKPDTILKFINKCFSLHVTNNEPTRIINRSQLTANDMKHTQVKSGKAYWSSLLIVLLWPLVSLNGCKNGGIFSRESTIYGTVTEVAGPPVDSIQLTIVVSKDLGNAKSLFRVSTDKDGNYKAIVDVPNGYGTLLIGIPYTNNTAFTSVYQGYEVYKEGKITNDCCSAKVGGKSRYDFKVYK